MVPPQLVVILGLMVIFQSPSLAAVDFVKDVQPIFREYCVDCHGEEKQKSGLRLDIKSVAMRGGDNHGPDIVPGDPEASPLIQFVTSKDSDERMPPKKSLSLDKQEILVRWIKEGARWPDGVDSAELPDLTKHWSFLPLKVPEKKRSIDWFIDEKLKELELTPVPPADPADWLRRVTFNLTGLAPTPAELEHFTSQDEPDFSAEVDRLLASERYGERWAQHWLDVVRYADTHGFEVNTERPHAWPYRDYVIRAFNRDLPYDQFVREQIAGDTMTSDADPATGFLVTASVLLPGQIGKDAPSIRLARQDSLDEIVTNIGQTFLGLSIGCARCHDHKFDPISAEDYYSMQAFVAGVEYGNRELRDEQGEKRSVRIARLKKKVREVEFALADYDLLANPGVTGGPLRPAVGAGLHNVDRFQPVRSKRVRFTIKATNSLEPCLDEIEVFATDGRVVSRKELGAVTRTSGDRVEPGRHSPVGLNDSLYGNTGSWMGSEKGGGWVELEFANEEEISKVIWSRDRTGKFRDRLATQYQVEVQVGGEWTLVADQSDRRVHLSGMPKGPDFIFEGLDDRRAKAARKVITERNQLRQKLRETETGALAYAGVFRKPDAIHLLNRGDPEQPKKIVGPAIPGFLGKVDVSKSATEQERRIALARWISSPVNPLVARVIVNRIWQGHFGVGLVDTPNDLGHMGTKPSHPHLLDWLAQEFIRGGWKMKDLHREIVLSNAYRRSTKVHSKGLEKDVSSRFLWRFPRRRLEGEAIRDSMLAISGQLNLRMYGRGFNLFNQRGGLSGFEPVEKFTGDGLRRMIYAHKVRRERDVVFGAFDCPDAGQSTDRRRESTTPIQALNLFNSQFTIDVSKALAARVVSEVGEDQEDQIRKTYQLILGRLPDEVELAEAGEAVSGQGLEILCRVLFNSNEFLFLP